MESIKELNELIKETLELRISDWELLMELYNRANMMYTTTIHIMTTYAENQQQVVVPSEELNILKENYRQSYEIMSNLDETIQTILEKRSNYILFKIITLFELGMDDEANNLCKKIVSCFNKDDIDHNLIMYYYHARDTKTERMKYINCAKKLIRKNGSYSDYRLIFQILRKESTSEKQLKELNDLLYHYIFNYFE